MVDAVNEFALNDERLTREIECPVICDVQNDEGEQIDESPSRWLDPTWAPETDADVLALGDEASEREVAQRPWALVLDGGDLRDIARMLEEVGAPCVRLTSGVPGDDDVPRRLMVASGNRAFHFDADADADAVDKDDRVVTMALLTDASKTLARQVRNMGFDYVVERPVQPDALRHLLIGALYRGDERRCEPRYSAGYPIHYRSGWRRRDASLIELSRFGCSLRIADAPNLKEHLKICLPAEFTGKAPLTLAADILRVEREGRVANVATVFHRDAQTRARVGALLPQLRRGPLKLAR
jgi:hypothetical protein